MNTCTIYEILERVDRAYRLYFRRIVLRPPKIKNTVEFNSIQFKQHIGYALYGNVLVVKKIKKHFKFSLSRPYEGEVLRLCICRNKLGEYFICLYLDKQADAYGKTHDGASVGIDFGLKKYLTLSDGLEIDNPQLLKRDLQELRRRSRNLSKCKKSSNNRKRKKLELDRLYRDIMNKRSDFQWKLAHSLCKRYDLICLEDLNLKGMSKRWGRKVSDLAHGNFVLKLERVAKKYGVRVHKIDRFFPSSKLCTCGYKNDGLSLKDRSWTCPKCGAFHKRDLFAAENILRQGIVELGSDNKSPERMQGRSHVSHPTIPCK